MDVVDIEVGCVGERALHSRLGKGTIEFVEEDVEAERSGRSRLPSMRRVCQ